MKRILIPPAAFLLGSTFITSFYIGILTWAQGWDYASSQFVRDRWYVIPIILGFGVQTALYSILRFGLFIPVTSTLGKFNFLVETSICTFILMASSENPKWISNRLVLSK